MTTARLAAAVGLAACVVLGGCGADTPRVQEVRGHPESAQLEVTADTCNAHPTASVEETDAEVRVLLKANRSWGDAACADSVVVTLSSVLGRRAVVDAATDERLEVLPPA